MTQETMRQRGARRKTQKKITTRKEHIESKIENDIITISDTEKSEGEDRKR